MRSFILALIILIWTFGSSNSQFQYNNQYQFRPYNIFSNSGYAQQTERTATEQLAIRQRLAVDNKNQVSQTGSNAALRVSERKCSEYLRRARSNVLVGSLSLIPIIQDIHTDDCDASQGLIIGGENAKAGEFPHMAAIGYGNLNSASFKCGGSLISEQFVLTAAHCRSAEGLKPSVVRLGDLNLRIKDRNSPEIDVAIADFIVHENYDPNKSKNDIAVVKLVSKVALSKHIRPACLFNPSNTARIPKAIATGWGITEFYNDYTSDIMQKVELPIIDLYTCKSLLDDNHIDESQMCAGEYGKDTCLGDSGGPLQVVSSKNRCVYILIGITSYGSPYCGGENTPGVYTRVSYYLNWIEQKVWGSG